MSPAYVIITTGFPETLSREAAYPRCWGARRTFGVPTCRAPPLSPRGSTEQPRPWMRLRRFASPPAPLPSSPRGPRPLRC
eukprot:7269316-Pyramimonas_sp.AAC.1